MSSFIRVRASTYPGGPRPCAQGENHLTACHRSPVRRAHPLARHTAPAPELKFGMDNTSSLSPQAMVMIELPIARPEVSWVAHRSGMPWHVAERDVTRRPQDSRHTIRLFPQPTCPSLRGSCTQSQDASAALDTARCPNRGLGESDHLYLSLYHKSVDLWLHLG